MSSQSYDSQSTSESTKMDSATVNHGFSGKRKLEVKVGGSQGVSAYQMMKKSPAATPMSRQKGIVIIETQHTRVPENSGVNVRASKGKGVLVEERLPKRAKTFKPVPSKLGIGGISRAEIDGDEILSPYLGDPVIFPPAENSMEEVQEEIRGFIPQALRLANDVTLQMNKMAVRIKDLEAETVQAKSVEKQLQDAKEDLKGQKAMVQQLKVQLAHERAGTHALCKKITSLETQLHGAPVVDLPFDVQLDHLMRDVEIAAEAFGYNSKECNFKRASLDRMLRAQAAFAEQKAKETEDARKRR